ncbi:MAG: lysophospholipase [Planctomycetes bacterium]|nr:lysophospholipase [Planctomycetota bacterium]
MSELESFATYLELRESDAEGDVSAGLSHTAEGLVLFHVLEVAARGEPQGIVAVVHDAADHGGRYEGLAAVLAERGFAVALPDMRGHGKTEGARGHSAGRKEVVRDLDEVLQHLAYRLVGAPKTLIGVGRGALQALALCADRPGLVERLVLVAPELSPKQSLPEAKKGFLGKMLSKVGPEAEGSLGRSAQEISADPDAAQAWSSDELVHDIVTLRAGEEFARLAQGADDLLRGAGVPVLVMLGGEDAVGATEWPAAAAQDNVEVKSYPAGRHHLFHDATRDEVTADLLAWLTA